MLMGDRITGQNEESWTNASTYKKSFRELFAAFVHPAKDLFSEIDTVLDVFRPNPISAEFENWNEFFSFGVRMFLVY